MAIGKEGQDYRPTKSPVLFLIFNRPRMTARVFNEIRKARPPRLYLAADGPRQGILDEKDRVNEVRRIVTEVDWPCAIFTLFRDENLGCKVAVSEGIDWFFENETQGIILEDDCLPDQSFFKFCDELLDRYAEDERITAITGNNFQEGRKRGNASYYFSKYNHVWGWATWRRAWRHYDSSLEFWNSWRRSPDWVRLSPNWAERRYWDGIFQQVRAGEIDTWDYAWTASAWRQGGLTATPNMNLVENIGFGPQATHTTEPDSFLANIPAIGITEIIHPAQITQDVRADQYTFSRVFGGGRSPFFLRLLRFSIRVLRESFSKIRR